MRQNILKQESFWRTTMVDFAFCASGVTVFVMLSQLMNGKAKECC